MADYKVGVVLKPEVELAVAVAASSAFPPILSPVELDIDPSSWDPTKKGRCTSRRTPRSRCSATAACTTTRARNAWKRYTRIWSATAAERWDQSRSPKHDWARQAYRTLSVIDTQVRNLRKRQVVAGFLNGERDGTYWGIRSDIGDYGPPTGSLPCPNDATDRLAQTGTRLAHMDDTVQERLINWGTRSATPACGAG